MRIKSYITDFSKMVSEVFLINFTKKILKICFLLDKEHLGKKQKSDFFSQKLLEKLTQNFE